MKLTLACLLVLALIAGVACTQTAEVSHDTGLPPAATQVENTEAPLASTPAEEENETPPPATVTEEDVEAARQVVFDYWEAFNSYDVDGVLAFLEESYRQEREEDIKSEIGQMQMFGITLGVEEEAEPTITDEMVAIKMLIETPLGEKHYTYCLTEIDSEWKICSAEE